MSTLGEDIAPEVRRWVEIAEQLLVDSKFQEAADAFHAASTACLEILPRPAARPTADELARVELARGNARIGWHRSHQLPNRIYIP